MTKRKHETIEDDEKSTTSSGVCNIILNDYLRIGDARYDKFVDGITCRFCGEPVGFHQRDLGHNRLLELCGKYVTAVMDHFMPSIPLGLHADGGRSSLYQTTDQTTDYMNEDDWVESLVAAVNSPNKKSKPNEK